MEQTARVVTKIEGPGTSMMKVSGILMIIFGGIGLAMQLIASAGIALAVVGIEAFASQGLANEVASIKELLSSVSTAYLIATVAAVVTLVAGILAVVFCRKLGKGTAVVIFAGLAIILTIVFNISFFSSVAKIADYAKANSAFESLDTSFKFGLSNIISLVSSLILPFLAILGTLKNKKAA